MHLQALRRDGGQPEISIFIENDELPVGQDKAGFGKVSRLPSDFPSFHFDSRQRCGSIMAARTINVVTDPENAPEMNTYTAAVPDLLHFGFATSLAQMENTAASPVRGGQE